MSQVKTRLVNGHKGGQVAVMLKMLLRIGLAFMILGSVAVAQVESDTTYETEIERWRSERTARLTSEGGWLSLIGLHFLKDGDNTLGSAEDNDIVLAAGPEYLGTVHLGKYARVKIQINPGQDVRVDGVEMLSADLADGRKNKPTLVTAGTMSFYVIERGGKKALRVKDSASARRRDFGGIDYFPIDLSWRIQAQWVPFDQPKSVPIKNILGQESMAMVLGKVVFEREGQTYELLPLQDSFGAPLFLIIADETSGEETYGAARFVYADAPKDGVVMIDFNKAINPPCAYTPFATCPLPPAENVMPIAVRAGEKDYRGSHLLIEE